MAPAKREIRFNMLFSSDEMNMLRCVGDAMGLTSSDTVRFLVRDAFREQCRDAGRAVEDVLEQLRDTPGLDREGTVRGATLEQAEADKEKTRAARRAAASTRSRR